MAVFFSHLDSKKNGPQFAKDYADLQVVVKDPLKSDTYAAFMAKAVAQAAFTGTDMAFTEVSDNLVATINGKSDVDQSATAALEDDLCLALVDSVNEKVLYCTDVTDKLITNVDGETVSWNTWSITFEELVSAA
ncbi:hypothetical protein Q4575_05275 [Psychrosphaera sp. 1_MG-2023]|uniref:hypothetical protein n=1 Tax=Psychrosphaera sp. 1_MG-2023 TaxID=3062643 RepID=UPI0026E1DCDD|nr:hypothetical protein [Psychrosphaera sp. 1_MG-2023]MDO6718801.1 hypothetical protein [Psychrosphaera sp. 1_MG-2023]